MPQVETSDPQKSAQNTALFVQCVSMYAQQAMISMGKLMNPVTNKAEKNLEAARFFIDMLEMLDVKTRGNLGREEERILQSSLSSVRLTFVEEIDAATKSAGAPKAEPEKDTKAPEQAATAQSATQQPAQSEPSPEENKKKFTKKYD
jgi:hypothetical protein